MPTPHAPVVVSGVVALGRRLGAVRNVVQDAANLDVLGPCVSDPDKRGPRLGAPAPRSSLATDGLQPRELVVKQLANLGAVGIALGL
jgi:hypothetical protein